jgi:hypothetical protein
MRDRNLDLVLAIFMAAALAGAAAVRAPGAVLLPLGLAVLFLAGYVASEAMLGETARGAEGAALTAVLVLGLPALGGVILHGEGVSLHRGAWITLLVLVTLLSALVVSGRREPVADRRPLEVADRFRSVRFRALWRRYLGEGVVMAAAALVAAAAVGTAVAGVNAQPQSGFTELSLVPRGGTAIMRVKNFEGNREHYLVEVTGSGSAVVRYRLDLDPRDTWTQKVPLPAGRGLRADLFVRGESLLPYRSVYLARTR